MASSTQSHSLKALVVYKNLMHPALIRTVHVYRLEEGKEEEVEREYVFHHDRDYQEIGFCNILTLHRFRTGTTPFKGLVHGVWLCIYVFDTSRSPSDLNSIPTILSVSSNPKLSAIPTLANDLHIISELTRSMEIRKMSCNNTDETEGSKNMLYLDLNSPPCPQSENYESDPSESGVTDKKKKRATAKDIAGLALEDLAKYFGVPIVEASKCLNVGLTVLKKKCREFGIPRWPHRKIKSLDSLIHELQEEVERQKEEDKVAAVAVAKRQRMVESEKECIERKPFMEIQTETKKFRQDIFKKRHRARALENQFRTLPLF